MSSSSSSSSSSGPTYYNITLEKELSTYVVAGRTQAYRLVVTVIDATGLNDPNIFLYLQLPADAAGNQMAKFQCMCSPLDLETYPAGAPSLDSNGFFRLAQADLIYGSTEVLEETWRLLQSDRNELVRTLTKMNNLSLDITSSFDSTMIGTFPV